MAKQYGEAGLLKDANSEAVWRSSMAKLYGEAVWLSSMAKQYGEAVWRSRTSKQYSHAKQQNTITFLTTL
tara:strand:+ start:183 stop:392 length:210 start_codon:yes stop_codon:yes gene_type:complete